MRGDMNGSISQKNMFLSSIPLCGLLLIFNLEPSSTYPISTGFSGADMDILKVLLQKLEESASEQAAVDEGVSEEDGRANRMNTEDTSSERQSQTDLDEEQIREFLSAKNLKSLRNDSSKRSSGCFGRRMDRIGSMSSLGCNTIGRYNPKQR